MEASGFLESLPPAGTQPDLRVSERPLLKACEVCALVWPVGERAAMLWLWPVFEGLCEAV